MIFHVPCLGTIVPKTVYRYNAIPIKLPMAFFTEFVWKKRRSKIAKAILKKASATGGIRLPDFRPNVKVTLKKWNSMVLV